jgi:hypothetical protein
MDQDWMAEDWRSKSEAEATTERFSFVCLFLCSATVKMKAFNDIVRPII